MVGDENNCGVEVMVDSFITVNERGKGREHEDESRKM